MSNKKTIIAIVVAILGLLLILLSKLGLYTPTVAKTSTAPTAQVAIDKPTMVSSDPTFSGSTVLLPTQKIVLNFSKPLVNEPETKIKFDPALDYDLKLSNNNQTATITPKKTYPIGTDVTLFVMSDTKFQDSQKMAGDVVLHFKTLDYHGI